MNNRQFKEKRFWNNFAAHYDSFIKIMFRHTYKKILFHLDSELESTQKILDIGTGTGIIPFSVCRKVKSVAATDISPEMIKIAKREVYFIAQLVRISAFPYLINFRVT